MLGRCVLASLGLSWPGLQCSCWAINATQGHTHTHTLAHIRAHSVRHGRMYERCYTLRLVADVIAGDVLVAAPAIVTACSL